MAKSASVGTKFMVGTTAVGALKSIGGIEISADSTDVSDLGNADGYREKLAGFKDGGEVALSGFLDGSDAGQEALYDAMQSGDAVTCKIVFPAKIGKTWTFTGVVTKFSTSAELEDAIAFEATVAVSGKPVLAASAS